MIGAGLICLAIWVALRTAMRTRSLALCVLTASIIVFYGVRALGIATGMDAPTPAYLFTTTNIDNALTRFGCVVLLFYASAILAYRVSRDPASALARLLPFPIRAIRQGPLVTVTMLSTVFASALAMGQVAAHGSFAGAVYAAKAGRESGEAILRMPATVAVALSCALFYSAKRSSSGITLQVARLLALVCAAVSAVSASVWGSRQFGVVAAAYLLGGPTIAAFRNAKRNWAVRAVLVFLVVIGLGFGLRVYRDDALGGATAVTQAEENQFRQVTIAANGTLLDTSLLAVKDWPKNNPWRKGVDFRNGLWSALPTQLRPQEHQTVSTIGAYVHELYQPDSRSGWPIGAPTEWYINFGWLGVLIGGLLSGLVYRAIAIGVQRSPAPELSTMSTLILTLIVFPLGVSTASLNRLVVHAIPLALVLNLMQVGRARIESVPSAPHVNPHKRTTPRSQRRDEL